MPPIRRCIFGCITNGITLHCFPNPSRFPEQFKLWVDLIGEPIANLTPDEIFKKKKICDLHFAAEDRNRNNRLSAIATPVPFPFQQYTRKRRRRYSSLTSESKESDHIGGNDTSLEKENSVQSEELSEASIVPGTRSYSWQSRSEAVGDKSDNEDLVDNLSLYSDHEEREEATQEKNSLVHEGFYCDACRGEIKGFRYTCVQCEDFDLCCACESRAAHRQHYMLRLPRPKPYAELQFVIATIRQHLMPQLDPNKESAHENDDAVSIKSEVKSLVDDEEMEIEKLDEDLIYTCDSRVKTSEARLCNKDVVTEDRVNDTSINQVTSSNTQREEQKQQQHSAVASPPHCTNTQTDKPILSTAKEKIHINMKHLVNVQHGTTQAKEIRIEPVSDKESRDKILKLCVPRIKIKQGSKLKLFKLPPGTILKPGEKVPFQLLPKRKG